MKRFIPALILAAASFPLMAQTAPKAPSTIAEYKVAIAERDLKIAEQNKDNLLLQFQRQIDAVPQVVAATQAVNKAQAALDDAKKEVPEVKPAIKK
jgi:type III secretion system FlhB-like substrate exporter